MVFSIFQANKKAKSAEVNANFAFISGGRLIAINASTGAAIGTFPIGDLTAITNGSLAGDLLARTGNSLKVYNASGALIGSVSYDDMLNLRNASQTQRGTAFLPSQITIANNASDANNDIDSSAGVFQFSDGSGQAVAAALTKRLDAAWSAGTNQGGLDTGSKANSTWYHCYAIYNPTTSTSDFLFSTGATTPTTLPSGYTKFKRVGSIKTNGSGNIRAFLQYGNVFTFLTEVSNFSGGIGTTATTLAVEVPLGIITRVNGVFNCSSTSTGAFTMRAYSPNESPTSPSLTNFGVSGFGQTSAIAPSLLINCFSNLSSQITYKLTVVSGSPTVTGDLYTYGYTDINL